MKRPGRAALACAALALLLTGAALRRFAAPPFPDGALFSRTDVELGRALESAAHAARVDPTFRLPLGPLLESALERRGAASPAYFGACLLAALLAGAAGALLAGTFAGGAAASLALFVLAGQPRPEGALKMLLFAPLTLLPALALALRARRPGPAADWLAGLAFAPSLLYRSTLAFLPPLVALWTLARGRDRKAALSAARLLLPCALALLPVAWMNGRLHGSPTPFERGASDMLVVGGALGMVDTTPEGDRRALAPDAPEGPGVTRWAVKKVLAAPGAYALSVLRRLRFVFGLMPWLFLLAAAGLWRARRDPAAWLLAAAAAYFIGVHSLLATLSYYYVPVWPLLCALAAGLLAPNAPAQDGEAVPRAALLAVLLPALAAATAAGAVAVRYARRASSAPPHSLAAVEAALARDPEDARLKARRERLRLAAAGDAAGVAALLRRAGDGGPERLLEAKLADLVAYAQEGDAASARRAAGEAVALWVPQLRLTVARDERERAWEQRLRAGAHESLGRRAVEAFEGFETRAWTAPFADVMLAAAPEAAREPLLLLQPVDAQAACSRLRTLAKAAPSARAHVDAGVCAYLDGRAKDAAAAFRAALALDPSSEQAASSLAVAERDTKAPSSSSKR
jgi:hypothetical protein